MNHDYIFMILIILYIIDKNYLNLVNTSINNFINWFINKLIYFNLKKKDNKKKKFIFSIIR